MESRYPCSPPSRPGSIRAGRQSLRVHRGENASRNLPKISCADGPEQIPQEIFSCPCLFQRVKFTRNACPGAVIVGVQDEDEIERLLMAHSPRLRAILDRRFGALTQPRSLKREPDDVSDLHPILLHRIIADLETQSRPLGRQHAPLDDGRRVNECRIKPRHVLHHAGLG